jgi:hypothetical protein
MPTYVILKVGVMVGAASSRDFFSMWMVQIAAGSRSHDQPTALS